MKEFFTYDKTPEEAGVSSADILKLVKNLEHFGQNLHSFALIKGNSVIAEGYKKPFSRDFIHRMYSTSKTFGSMALGVLVGEGKVSVSDYVLKYFPEYDKQVTDPYVRNMKIEHLLKMATAYTYPTTYGVKIRCTKEPNWAETFFDVPSSHPSNTVFNYDTSASHIIGVIVEKVTGMPFIEYLKEKALLDIGFSKNARCLKAPEGYAWAGSAVMCTMLDLARLARLIMLDGAWDGKQLIDKDYVKAAKSRQIDNTKEGFSNTYKGHGYGYQLWCTADNTFSLVGMGQQLAICMPEEDLLFVCTGDNQGVDGAYHILFVNLWNIIKDNFSKTPLAPNPEALKELRDFCDNWEYHIVKGDATNPIADKINGKTFVLNENPMEITDITFNFGKDGECTLNYTNPRGNKTLKFGIGKAVADEFPEDGYFGDIIGTPAGRRYKCLTSGAWTSPFQFRIKCDVIDDYVGNLSIIAGFDENLQLGLYMEKHAEFFLDGYNGFAGGVIKE